MGKQTQNKWEQEERRWVGDESKKRRRGAFLGEVIGCVLSKSLQVV